MRAPDRIAGGVVRSSHVLERARVAEVVLRARESEQQRVAILGCRRLCERALEEVARLRRRAGRQRAVRLRRQRRRDRGLPLRLRVEEVRGDRPVGRAQRRQQTRRPAVGLRALARRQRAQHRIAHERVLEAQRAPVLQDARPHELIGRARRRLRRHVRERGRHGERRLVAQHRDGARKRSLLAADARHRGVHRTGDDVGPDPPELRDARLGERHATVAQPDGEAPDEQRIAAGGVVTRRGERGSDRRPVAAGQRRRRRPNRQPGRREHGHRRRGAQRAARRGRVRALRREHEHGGLLQPVRHELQKSHRRLVRPVHVIDRQQLRTLLRQPRDEPVEAMERRERRAIVSRRPARSPAAPPARRARPRRRAPAHAPRPALRAAAARTAAARHRRRPRAPARTPAHAPPPRCARARPRALAPRARSCRSPPAPRSPPGRRGRQPSRRAFHRSRRAHARARAATVHSPADSKCGVQERGAPRRDRRPLTATIDACPAASGSPPSTASR